MELFLASFIAGILTIAAPCILPLLPVVVGRSLTTPDGEAKDIWYRPYVITGSLGISVIIFTLLLKASTSLLGIPQEAWQIISGVIVGLFGLYLIWPHGWEWLSAKLNLSARSNKLMTFSRKKPGLLGDALLGFSLGPIFNSCSPTYLLIVALMLSNGLSTGIWYLFSYAFGLVGALLTVALLGQKAASKLGWLSNPSSAFKKIIGAVLIIVSLSILFGLDKQLQTFVLDRGWYAPVSDVELFLRD
jgi:cytochrome c-type biogenesis protein